MKLKVYNRENGKQRKTGSATINFQNKGMIGFSSQALRLLELKAGDRLEIAQDEDRPEDWYIWKSQNPEAFSLRGKPFETTCCIASANIFGELCDALKLQEKPLSINCLIGAQPVPGMDINVFAIITKSAKVRFKKQP